jgi:ankyrin repeat protein
VLLYLYDKLKDYFPSKNILDIPNNEGMTPFHLSCSYSFKNISDTLLLLGCNINSKDPKGYTPLHYAVKAENYRLCKKLIIFGAKKNLTDNENNTPGDIAKKTSNFSIRKLFTKNFFNQIDSIVNKRRDNLLFILLIIFSTLKYFFFFKSFNANNIMNYIYIISFIIDVI